MVTTNQPTPAVPWIPDRRLQSYLTLLAGLALSRLVELAHSRGNERSTGPPLGVAAAAGFPLMVALHVGLFLLPPAEILARRLRSRRQFWTPALLALTGASCLRIWSIHSLGEQWNVRGAVPSSGHAVNAGPYRFVRHPNYVAVSLEMLAVPLAWPAPLSAITLTALNAAVLTARIRAEERLLARLPGYNESMLGKKRFIPGLI